MNDFKEFYQENRVYTICFIILTIICFAGVWLVYDYERNRPVYQDTDTTMERIENRIQSLESRIDRMSERLAETQETVNGISAGIKHSTELAGEVADGIGSAETRLDNAIQRSGRIANIISDIERTSK